MGKNTRQIRVKDMLLAKKNEDRLIRANIELTVIYEQNLAEIDRINVELEKIKKYIKLNYDRDFWKGYEHWSKREIT